MLVYCDLHIFSTNVIKSDFDYKKTYDEDTLFIGDIFDLANAKKSELDKCREIALDFISRHPNTFIPGNHERISPENKVIVKDNTLFAHGDMESDPVKWAEYRSKPQGASFFKRGVIVPLIEEAEKIIDRQPNVEFLGRARILTKAHGVNRYCCGHFHPKTRIDVEYQGLKVTICERGLNIISF